MEGYFQVWMAADKALSSGIAPSRGRVMVLILNLAS